MDILAGDGWLEETMRLEADAKLETQLLGDRYPYVWTDGGTVHYAQRTSELLSEHKGRRTLDTAALLSVLSFEHVCLDRTLIEGVTRLPWLSTLHGNGEVEFHQAPPHGHKRLSPRALASVFLDAAAKELEDYARGKSQIYLLLSGGMDSRVVAAILHKLMEDGRVNIPVHAVTWGHSRCRDVVYAEGIAKRYGWDWTRLPLDSSTYRANFELAASAFGAEVDPKHMHRIDWFRQVPADSLVLAASYGDSVGRAEFGSRHLSLLRPLKPNDRCAFLRAPFFQEAKKNLEHDLRQLRLRHGERSEAGWLEVGRQAHYMRRHLYVVMDWVSQFATFKQAFVTPEVFRLIWNTDIRDRTDQLYVECLRLLDADLLTMPWARTGLSYETGRGAPDKLDRTYHQYGLWLRREHSDLIETHLFDGTLDALEAIDVKQVRWMFEEWQLERDADNTALATHLSALAALSVYANKSGMEPPLGAGRDRVAACQLARASQFARRASRPIRVGFGR